MSTAVVTAWDHCQDALGRAVWPNRVAYATAHKYALPGGLVPGEEGFWIKPSAIRKAFAQGHDLVAWMDADAWITNPDVKLESRVQAPLTFGRDIHGPNLGIMLWERTNWTLGFLEKWEKSRSYFASYPNSDQTALAHILYLEGRQNWECATQRSFNSYRYSLYGIAYEIGEWRERDFILHLPGLSTQKRLEVFEELSQ